jgi:hypothetical protein
MPFFPEDSKLLNALTYLPDLQPDFEMIKSVLVWKDEIPQGITEDGMEKLWDLLIARSLLQCRCVKLDHINHDKVSP